MSDASFSEDLAWPILQRLKFIEFSLFWENKIGRHRLEEQFGISRQQATKDINLYQNEMPGGIFYNPKLRAYIPGPNFKPVLIQTEASEYLRHMDALRLKHKTEKEIWIHNLAPFEDTNLPERLVETDILKTVLSCIHNRQSLEIEYIALSKSTGNVKRITPHTLCTDGNRWHVRAYNHKSDRFSDYPLSRMVRAADIGQGGKNIEEDGPWNKIVEIQICPDPELNAQTSEMVQVEYGMKKGSRKIKTRQAMLWYVLRRLGFNPHDTEQVSKNVNRMRNESSFSLHLNNLDEIEVWLERRK